MADDIFQKINEARSAGHSDDDITGYLSSDPELGPQVKDALASGHKPTEILNYLSAPPDEKISRTSYANIWSDPTSGVFKKALKTAIKAQNEMGHGVTDVVTGLPGAAVGLVQGAMPTAQIPVPGGRFAQDAMTSLKKAKDLAENGQWSEAAKNIPVFGGMYDYATTHAPMETAGALLGGEATGGLVKKGIGKLGEMPAPPPTVLGSTPTVRSVIGVLKPANAIKAVDDYPAAMARLKAEDPTLGQPNPDFLNQLRTAINGALTENRHYYEGHVSPVKATGMTIPLDNIADAIDKSISPKLRLEDPQGAAKLEAIADRYRTKTSLPDLENMLQETNAQVRAMNSMAPGAQSQAIRASETKAVLDAQAHSFRDTFYKALDRFNVGDDVKAIQREYGKLLGFKLDAEELYNRVLREGVDPSTGMLGKAAKVASAVGHPVRTAGRLVGQVLAPSTDDIATLQKAFRDFKGQAPAYPTPPIQAPAGRPQLPAAPPPPAGALNAPTNAPAPQGPIPPGMGPSAVYPTNQRALPPATTRFHPGETYGPGGTGPVVSSETLPPIPPPPPTVGMFRVHGPNGPEFISHEELLRRLAAQKGRK